MEELLGFDPAWITVVISVLGMCLAIIAFANTPIEKRFGIPSYKPFVKKLISNSDIPQTQIVKGDKKKAVINMLPTVFVLGVLILFTLYVHGINNPECTNIFGVSVTLLIKIELFYIIPSALLILSLTVFKTGTKTLKLGYFPPLDAIVFSDTISSTGRLAKARGILLVILPLYCLVFIWYGHTSFQYITNDENVFTMSQNSLSKCK
jgi:hypothetical protein